MRESKLALTPLVTHRLGDLLDSVTRGWLIVVSGSFGRLALGLVASVVIARSLGPAAFGIYAVLATTGTIVGGFADLGLTTSAVRRLAAFRAQSLPGPEIVTWRVFFWLRIVMASVAAVVGMLVAGPLARALGIAGEVTLLRLTLIGVIVTALSGSVTALLQATGRFGRLSAVMLTNAGLTVLLAILLSLTDQLKLTTAIVVLGIGTSLASFVVGYRLLPEAWPLAIPSRNALNTTGRDLLSFGLWVWIAGLFALLAAQLDVLLVNRWSDSAVVGAYALALSLASKADVVNHSLHAVLLPAASSLSDPMDVRSYIRRGLVRSGLIGALLLALIPLADPLITTIYGVAYQRSVGLFQGLLVVAVLEVLVAPLLMLAYTFDHPRLLAVAGAARVATLVIVAGWLIPVLGPSGAIVAKLTAVLVGSGLVLAAFARSASMGQDKPLVEDA